LTSWSCTRSTPPATNVADVPYALRHQHAAVCGDLGVEHRALHDDVAARVDKRARRHVAGDQHRARGAQVARLQIDVALVLVERQHVDGARQQHRDAVARGDDVAVAEPAHAGARARDGRLAGRRRQFAAEHVAARRSG
jgi:hypothetical protein